MDKNLIIYSWNILNPKIGINRMSWKTTNSKEMAVLDFARFTLFRKNAIMDIIHSWFNTENNVVVCLQEVCMELINEFRKNKHMYKMFRTKNNSKDDYRVTLVKGMKVNFCQEIKLNINSVKKHGLKIILDNNMDIFNVHLHWKWSNNDMKTVGKIIEENVSSEKFIICGDMNKTQKTIQNLLDVFDCILIDDSLKGYTGINTQNGKKDIIDHIFPSTNIENISKIKIIKKVDKYKIMYDFEKILKMKNLTAEQWVNKRLNKDVSDHKPIRIKIQ